MALAGWGANQCGEMGDGTTNDVTTPVRLPMPQAVLSASLSACGACAVLADESLWCWGNYGMGTTSKTPVNVTW